MPVGVLSGRTISEAEEPDNTDGDVHFFLPNSRRQSEEESAAATGSARARPIGMSKEVPMQFLLFHTFHLPSQSGPSQVVLLSASKRTGIKVLAACRDDCFRCFYFQFKESAEEIQLVPKALTMRCLPIEKGWKVGALSCAPRTLNGNTASDLVAYTMYRSPQVVAEGDIVVPNSWLVLATLDPNDEDLEDNPAKHNCCGGALSFLPYGCNQLIWWKNLGVDSKLSLIIPGQDDHLYAMPQRNLAGMEELRWSDAQITNAFESVAGLKDLSYLTSINALDYIDLPADAGIPVRRIIAVSHKPRSEIVLGSYNHMTNQWTQLWTSQHDSMISRIRLFATGQEVNLLVIGLCEASVVYRNIIAGKTPKPLVLPESTLHDVVTCCEISDVNNDSQPEILLGTYGRAVLIYKFPADADPFLLYTIETAFPVHYVTLAALTGADTQELLVVTLKGVHVYSLL